MVHLPKRLLGATVFVALTLPVVPARAATDIYMVGTLNTPAVATVTKGTSVTWHNMEPADYPVVNGDHDVSGDQQVADALGVDKFPLSSKMIAPGGSYTCTGVSSGISCKNDKNVAFTLGVGTYAYKCTVHPDQQRGILIVQ